MPPNRITDKSKRILEDNISLFEYYSSNIEELVKTTSVQEEIKEVPVKEKVSTKGKGEFVVIKESK